jgi:hypothetical protein
VINHRSDGEDAAKVPQREKEEVLAAFAAHKDEVTQGFMAAVKSNEAIPIE